MSQLEYEDAIEERRQIDREFKYGTGPQVMTCDTCGCTGSGHAFGRFSFRGQAPKFLCVPCILDTAGHVVQHCKEKQIPVVYEKPA